jgi:hypothetical protein
MNEVSTELSPEEVAEIERHKYFLSEKAGYDVGWEFAEADWREKFSDQPGHCLATDGEDDSSRSLSSGPLGRLIKRIWSKAAL